MTMPENYLKNSFVCNSAFDMFIKCNDIQNAELIFSKMHTFVIGYGRLMQIYNKEKTPEKTIVLYEQMKEKGIKADRIIYLLLINACSQIGLFSTCQRIIAQIPQDILVDPSIKCTLLNMWVSNHCSLMFINRFYR